jgi:hypothetical protein
MSIYFLLDSITFTYDHRTLKTRLPVRSALFKQRTGGLVVRWVTTSEYPLLYVFIFFCSAHEEHAPRNHRVHRATNPLLVTQHHGSRDDSPFLARAGLHLF